MKQNLARQFPILSRKMRGRRLVYLDNAATTQKPASVISAEKNFYENSNANIHRGIYELSEQATAMYINAHQKVADFIGAAALEEIIFTRNATEGINLVARAWPKQKMRGRQILVTAMEHHSNLLPWQWLARETGAKLAFVEMTGDGRLDLADLQKKLAQKTALLVVTHVSNVLGVINPVAEIVALAHREGALVLVDAAQSVARLPVNVQAWDADYLVFSGHKMYGPLGIGVLYGKKTLLEEMPPFLFGGDMVLSVRRNHVTWNSLPWKFEAGTPNIAGAVGLAAAIDFLKRVGIKNIGRHEEELVRYILPKLAEVDGVKILGYKGPQASVGRTGVISFTVDGLHSHDLVSLLDGEGIAVRGGHHCAQPLLATLGIEECVRISFGVTTTKKELELFLSILRKSIKLLRG